MNRVEDKSRKRLARKKRVRKNIFGTSERPRLTVFKSNVAISVQVIDDVNGKTLVSASSYEKDMKDVKSNIAGGKKVGEIIGKRCVENNIKEIVFDRNGYFYHGVVKALADAAREAGVKF